VLALDAHVRHVTLTWPWITGAFLLAIAVMAQMLARSERVSAGTLVNLALLALALLAALLFADLGTSVYLGLSAPNTDLPALARTDPHAPWWRSGIPAGTRPPRRIS
jgi:hypothetical protein